jgi:choline-glycine betaine transporter
MPSPHEVRRATTPFFSVVLIILGVAILVRTLVAGVHGVAYGLVLGVLFIAAGAGRLWVARRVG